MRIGPARSAWRGQIGHGTRVALMAGMSGYITEANFDECEEAFPGIVTFFGSLQDKPRTFLQLLALFMKRPQPAPRD